MIVKCIYTSKKILESEAVKKNNGPRAKQRPWRLKLRAMEENLQALK